MSSTNEKKTISVRTNAYIDFESSLESIRHNVNQLIEEYGENAYISEEAMPYEVDRFELVLYTKRLETDEEYESRIKKESESAAKKEERERREFERLQKKFGGND